MSTRTMAWALCVAVLAGTGCGQFSHEERLVSSQVEKLGVYLSQGAFDKAASLYTDDFVWISDAAKGAAPTPTPKPGTKPGPKPKVGSGVAAFHQSIRQIPSRTAVFIEDVRIRELGPTEMLVVGTFRVRASDAMSQRNTQWKFSMTVLKVGATWKIKQIKELSARGGAGN